MISWARDERGFKNNAVAKNIVVKKSRGLKAVQKSKPRLEMIQRGKNFKK